MLTRRKLIMGAGLSAFVTALFGFAGIGYATQVEPHRVRVTRRALTPDGWPPGRRLRIAVLADFHAHPVNMGEADIAEVVRRTNAESPDIAVILGDYGAQRRDAVKPAAIAGILRGLVAPMGVYAIQGNHDWTDDWRSVGRGGVPTRAERAFRAVGIPFLENQAIPIPGTPLWIAGIESEAAPGRPEDDLGNPVNLDRHRTALLERILEPVPRGAPVILLAHEPDIFATGLDERIVLTLSGHTHGGQIRILGWSPFIPSRYGMRYAYGHVVERGRHLVVSCGLGSHFVAGRPLRIGMPPEILVVDVGNVPEA